MENPGIWFLQVPESPRKQFLLPVRTLDWFVVFVWHVDGEPSDDGRQRRRSSGAEDREPAESRRRTADTDDTVLESHEQSSVASQDQGWL